MGCRCAEPPRLGPGARQSAAVYKPSPKARMREVAGICAVLVILVFIVFGQTLGFDFVNYDDNPYVYDNPQSPAG